MSTDKIREAMQEFFMYQDIYQLTGKHNLISIETRMYLREGKIMLKDFIKKSKRLTFDQVSDMFEELDILPTFGTEGTFEIGTEAHRLANIGKVEEAKTLIIDYIKTIQKRLLFL